MRLVALCLGWICAACAHADDIRAVLERSHQKRLHQFEAASADRGAPHAYAPRSSG